MVQKSSLMNVLSGIYLPEKELLNQKPENKKMNPDIASSFRIGMVHQEFDYRKFHNKR